MNDTMIKISSKDNSFIKHINKLIKSAKYRREQGQFIAEGVRICVDAADSGAEIFALIISEQVLEKYSDVIERLKKLSEKQYIISESVFKDISDTKTPQGIMCVIKTLDKPTLFDKINSGGKFVALDNIQDPSNLGTILRTAEAVGVDGVILSKDCCDIYSPKVVRGSMGAVFRIPFAVVGNMDDFIVNNKNLYSYASVVDSDAEKITDILSFPENSILVIGNEGNGIKQCPYLL